MRKFITDEDKEFNIVSESWQNVTNAPKLKANFLDKFRVNSLRYKLKRRENKCYHRHVSNIYAQK